MFQDCNAVWDVLIGHVSAGTLTYFRGKEWRVVTSHFKYLKDASSHSNYSQRGERRSFSLWIQKKMHTFTIITFFDIKISFSPNFHKIRRKAEKWIRYNKNLRLGHVSLYPEETKGSLVIFYFYFMYTNEYIYHQNTRTFILYNLLHSLQMKTTFSSVFVQIDIIFKLYAYIDVFTNVYVRVSWCGLFGIV